MEDFSTYTEYICQGINQCEGIEFTTGDIGLSVDTGDMTTSNYITHKRAMIFGVTGQDGSYLSEILLENGYKVIGVKRRSSVNNEQRLEDITSKDFKVVEGDVTDSDSIYNLIRQYKPSHIFNLAAQSHVGTSFTQPIATWESTATGCVNILNAIKTLNTNIRFYQASTSEMFGKNYDIKSKYNESLDTTTCIKCQDETTNFAPQSPYAVAKVAAHNMVKLYRESYGIFACSGILFNHESPRRGENFVTRKITKYVGELLNWLDWELGSKSYGYGREPKEEDFTRFKNEFGPLELGNLDARRDWGHAKDYCRGMMLMLEQEKPDDYVLATGETRSVKEFLDAAFSYAYGLDYNKFVEINLDFFRPAEVDYLLGDPSKAINELGWEREYSFKELVEEMVESDRLSHA